MYLRFGIAVLVVFALAFAGGVAARSWMAEPTKDTATTHSESADYVDKRGAMLFTLHCAKCHGDAGRGDAEGAEKLKPPPRDFASRPWRFEVSEKSIRRVIENGIPGTSMPSAGALLLEADIEALTRHVLKLANQNADAGSVGYKDDPFRAAGFHAVDPRAAPALKLEGVANQSLALADLQGKVVLLNFWGVSCEHCLARMPELAKFQSQFDADEFTVINICADESDAAAAAEMLAETKSGLSTYVDPTGLANGKFEVSLMPTLWLIDRDGRLIAKAQGAREWTKPQLRELIQSLIARE